MHHNPCTATRQLLTLLLLLTLCACSQDKAFSHTDLSTACDAGDGAQCHRLALIFRSISYTDHNTFLIKGCDRGHHPSCTDLNALSFTTELSSSRRAVFRSQDFIQLYQSSCDAGYLTSCARLAAHLLDGTSSLSQDIPRAESLLLRALRDTKPSEREATVISLGALRLLAHRYQFGLRGIPQDPEKSLQIFTQLCDIDPSFGCTELIDAVIKRLEDKDPSTTDASKSPEVLKIQQGICDNTDALKQHENPPAFRSTLSAIQAGCTSLCLSSFQLQRRGAPLPIPTAKVKKTYDITRSLCGLDALHQDPTLRTEDTTRECQKLIQLYEYCTKIPTDAALTAQQVEADLSKLSKVFLSCIDQHECQETLHDIASLYQDGVHQSTDKALSIYQALCDADHGSSCYLVGSIYNGSQNSAYDVDLAKAAYHKGCQRAHSSSCRESCQLGLAESCYAWGQLEENNHYSNGEIVSVSSAINAYKRGCALQHTLCCARSTTLTSP